MQIKFSRHARRRAALYKISETSILEVLRKKSLAAGENVFVETVEGIRYPLKIIVVVKFETATVVTNYPLKKGRGK